MSEIIIITMCCIQKKSNCAISMNHDLLIRCYTHSNKQSQPHHELHIQENEKQKKKLKNKNGRKSRQKKMEQMEKHIEMNEKTKAF